MKDTFFRLLLLQVLVKMIYSKCNLHNPRGAFDLNLNSLGGGGGGGVLILLFLLINYPLHHHHHQGKADTYINMGKYIT
jgi:hypothetical protein